MTSPSPDDTLAIVDTWFAEKVQRAPLSYHTECYNQMHDAWQDLRTRLGAEPLKPAEDDVSGSGAEGGGEPATSSETPGKSPKAGK